jgi:hypothetical protein
MGMKFFKLGLISILGLAGVLTLISLLLPSNVRISRAVNINAPKEKILLRLYYLPRWKTWNTFISSMPNASVNNNSLKNKDWSISIAQRSDTLVTATWQPFKHTSFNSGYALIPQGQDYYTLQWYFNFRLHWYPWEKFQSIIYDSQMGPAMEQSLQLLKKELEN